MSQLPLSLTLPPVFLDENFFVSDCNREAHQWVTIWPRWPAHALLIAGPKGSGKSHLGHIWKSRARAQSHPASMLDMLKPEEMKNGNWLIEDIERARDEKLLLHLFNITKEHEHFLLMTCNVSAQRLPFMLPDLTSRLLSVPCIAIAQPDDAVLHAAMQKQFADRQLKVDPDVVAYIMPRIERSLAKVTEIVEKLDKNALAEHRHITIPFVRRIMDISEAT